MKLNWICGLALFLSSMNGAQAKDIDFKPAPYGIGTQYNSEFTGIKSFDFRFNKTPEIIALTELRTDCTLMFSDMLASLKNTGVTLKGFSEEEILQFTTMMLEQQNSSSVSMLPAKTFLKMLKPFLQATLKENCVKADSFDGLLKNEAIK